MEDTATRAKKDREKQGPWEVEVSYGGEADLHKHLTGCDKNPGHQKFVPVDQFNVDHLPPGCHDNDLVDLVRAMSDLTVRVSVKYVSENRPETVRGKPYPSYKDRGRNMMRVGTGWVKKVFMYPDEYNFDKSCTCQECVNSPTPKIQFAHIHIQTAAHVVYDELEAAHVTCHFFFDKGGTPDACSSVVALTGASVVCKFDVSDLCEMRYVTHDLDLAEKLDKMVYIWNVLTQISSSNFAPISRKEHKSPSPVEELPGAKLAIVVSHPHGCSKQVSVGYWVDKTEDKGSNSGSNDVNKYESYTIAKYTTATCPGSSGAYVIMVKNELFQYDWDIAHCGNCEEDKNLNFCNFS